MSNGKKTVSTKAKRTKTAYAKPSGNAESLRQTNEALLLEAKEKLRTMLLDSKKVLNYLAHERTDEFAIAFCKAVLNDPFDPEEEPITPFLKWALEIEETSFLQREYRDVASFVLTQHQKRAAEKLSGKARSFVLEAGSGIVTLAELAREDFHSTYDPARFPGYELWQNERLMTPHHLAQGFFGQFANDFEWSLARVYRHAYQGVPVFRIQADGSPGAQLTETEPLSGMMWMLGKRFEAPQSFALPDWFHQYGMLREHLRAREIVWALESEITEADHDDVRQILRQSLGLTASVEQEGYGADAARSMGKRDIRLLNIALEHVQNTRQLSGFDRPGSWPLQKQVIDELKRKYALSDNQAKSIDIVTRPDDAR